MDQVPEFNGHRAGAKGPGTVLLAAVKRDTIDLESFEVAQISFHPSGTAFAKSKPTGRTFTVR